MSRYIISELISAITGDIADRFARANRSKLYSRPAVTLSKLGNDIVVDLCEMHEMDTVYIGTITNCTRDEYKKLQSSLRALGIDWVLCENTEVDNAIIVCNFDIKTRLHVYRRTRARAETCND